MWNRLHLSLKLTVALVAMQLISVTVGSVVLMTWLKRSRLTEVDRRIDAEADAIGDALAPAEAAGGSMVIHIQGEVVGDLYHDRFFYFAVVDEDGRIQVESRGPEPGRRKRISEALSQAQLPSEQPEDIVIDGERWRISKEALDRSRFPHSHAVMYVARNIDQENSDLDQVRRYLVLGSILLVLVASSGSTLIVSKTTSNLRRFARDLCTVKPEGSGWMPPSPPKSAEERLLFQSFQGMLTDIQNAFASQRLFIANASHELKSPVAGMMTALEVILARPRSVEEYQQTCYELLQTVRGLKKLTNALLDLAKLESGLPTKNLRRNEVGSIIDVVIDRLTSLAEKRDIRLSLEAEPELWLHCDEELLAVALTNLVENGIKYTDAKGAVAVTAASVDGGIKIVVRDTGCGMRADDVKQLGQMFFRVDASRSVELSYGLGFAQAKRIIESMDGNIAVSSSLHQGTEVLVTLHRQPSQIFAVAIHPVNSEGPR